MAFKLKNKKGLEKYLADQIKRIESILIRELEILVAKLENHAKRSAEYEDQTSNLKSSIGGVVLKDGRPITFRGFSGTSDGTSTGLEFLNSLISEHGRGYVILVVAGMNYASYVENYHDLNVLKKTELKMERDLPKILKRLKLTVEK